ncbi:sodium:proton antiporter [Microterricola viridarii]|uniref:Multisubunit sodium/proton antiporter, MrpC subunit n=1 Tax=Microterricola viridarii TaxID=412690 RepID=A0A1H1Z9V4_9MICO|nr:NADH-quinone oxidoreductase subunit K [Microterricola viridarii]SDT29966.1 multisubunit sodium/proton antiporter, MrpC subunit [Microterricola viridarii]
MNASMTLILLMAVMYASGVYVMLERSLTRVLIGFLLVGNATNILLFLMSGRPGLGPIMNDGVDAADISDPLPQALILTAIVINLGITAFMLALIYRSWWLAQLGAKGDLIDDEEQDLEDALASAAELRRSEDDDTAIHAILDASDEHLDATGDVDDTARDADTDAAELLAELTALDAPTDTSPIEVQRSEQAGRDGTDDTSPRDGSS